MRLKIGVAGMRRGVGFGRLFAARKDCELVAVCDVNKERAEATAATLDAKAYDNFDRLCDSEVDAIAIITPAPVHCECALKALDAGKHVLSEIPAVWSLEEAEQLARKVEQTGLKYMIAENVNYFPAIQAIDSLVKSDRIGKVFYAEGAYIHDGRSMMMNRDDGLGGGIGQTPTWRARLEPIRYCTHETGPILMILDDRIVSAVCMDTGSNVAPEMGTFDMQVAIFRTAGGCVIKELTGFSLSREPAFHFYSFYGTKGAIETDRYNPFGNLKAYFEDVPNVDGLTDIPTSLRHREAPPEAAAGGHGTSEFYMVDDFVRAILEDQTPPLDVYKALDMSVPGICANLSSQRCGELVTVPDFRPA